MYIAINFLFYIIALGLLMALGLNLGNATCSCPCLWMLGVLALYRMILENDRQETYNLGSLKYAIAAATPCRARCWRVGRSGWACPCPRVRSR